MIRYFLFALIIAFIITLIVMKFIPWINFQWTKYKKRIEEKEEEYKKLVSAPKNPKNKSRKKRKGKK